MPDEIEVLHNVTRQLEQADIAYMLTGSFAMSHYAVPRFTRDIDLVVALGEDDMERVVQLFDADYYVSRPAVQNAITRQSMFNLIHYAHSIKVDFVILKSSAYRQHEFARKQRITINDFEIWIVSKEDLILSKLIWAKDSHSEMQLRDVKNLLLTGYDEDYVNEWAKKLGLAQTLEECWQNE